MAFLIQTNILEHYLISGGISCLICGSNDIESGSHSTWPGVSYQKIICLECEGEWVNQYKLVSVRDITTKTKEEVSIAG